MVHIPDNRIPRVARICPLCGTRPITGYTPSLFKPPIAYVQCSSTLCNLRLESNMNIMDAIDRWNLRFNEK